MDLTSILKTPFDSSLYPQLPVYASFGQCDFRPAITAESFRPVVAQTKILKLLFIPSPFIRATREFNYASHAVPVNWRITGAVVGGNWNQRGNYAQNRTSAPPAIKTNNSAVIRRQSRARRQSAPVIVVRPRFPVSHCAEEDRAMEERA